MPSPSQVWHAPYGELNEKLRGASSSKDSPQNVQARDWEKLMMSSPVGRGLSPPSVGRGLSPPSVWTATEAMPSAS